MNLKKIALFSIVPALYWFAPAGQFHIVDAAEIQVQDTQLNIEQNACHLSFNR